MKRLPPPRRRPTSMKPPPPPATPSGAAPLGIPLLAQPQGMAPRLGNLKNMRRMMANRKK